MNVDDVLTRRVAKVLPDKEALKALMGKKKIRLYQGFDPTGERLHLGHTIGLRKLMDFAKLGHEVIFLFGTGTVLVGDPSERDTGRKLITQKEIDKNIQGWKEQVAPIVDFDLSNVKTMQNGDWLTKMTLKDIIKVASNISAVQLFKRESFTRRIERGDTVWYHETMYPLLQGYDSVVMDVDLEIGGTDQEFNMLIGRELQKKMNKREKFVLTVPMIVGVDGKQMSKTSGNCVWLDDTPEDMYGKLMRLPDEHIKTYFDVLTDVSIEEIKSLADDPLANKKRLALDITSQFHGKENAEEAQNHFEKTVQAGDVPEEIEEVNLPKEAMTVLEIASQAGFGSSNSERKRVISQGGFEIDGKKITDPTSQIEIKGGEVLRFGKRNYKEVII